MKVKFVLVMDYVVVEIHGKKALFDQLILEWGADMSQKKVLQITKQWIISKDLLTQRMVGLSRVGESSLTIEPVELGVKGG